MRVKCQVKELLLKTSGGTSIAFAKKRGGSNFGCMTYWDRTTFNFEGRILSKTQIFVQKLNKIQIFGVQFGADSRFLDH